MSDMQQISENLRMMLEHDKRIYDATSFICAIGRASNTVAALQFFVDMSIQNEEDNDLRELSNIAMDAMGALEKLDAKAVARFKAMYPSLEGMLVVLLERKE